MDATKPSPTITGQCFGFGNGRFGHPDQDRAISLREAALLQTFPRDFQFFPPDGEVSIQRAGQMIGNAVPPRFGEAIGKVIVAHFAGSRVSTRLRQ
jgi:DNA (cytosine-5)-methyltransferase 1